MDREFTFGEKAVGLSFNHAEGATHDAVHEIKQKFADVIDALHDISLPAGDKFAVGLRDEAIQLAVLAQMSAVKTITWGK